MKRADKTSLFLASSGALLALAALSRCSPPEPEIVGGWMNGTKQVLVVGPDLTGQLTQSEACAPTLSISVRRDPYEGFSIRFDECQTVFFPADQREMFGAKVYFGSSKDSVPMCSFCRIEDRIMKCKSPKQKIDGGGSLTHDCNWMRVSTSSTSTTAAPCTNPRASGNMCAGGAADAGTGGDAGAKADAGRADAGA